MITGVHHVGIVVADLDAAARLFEELPGLERTQRLPLPGPLTSVFYRRGPVSIEPIEVGDLGLRARRLGPDGTQARIEHVALVVEDLAHTVAALAAGGARFTSGAGVPDSTAGGALQLVQPLEPA